MKLMRCWYAFVLLLACFVVSSIGVSWGQQAAPAPKTVVIRAGRLLDVKTGRLLAQQEIVIEGDKIKAVRTYDSSPSGEQFIDLTNATVLPGLIDAHTHITFNPNFGYSRLAISVPREALIGARDARVTLEAGFTTIRNVGAQRIQRCRFARCHQRRRRAGTAHASQWASPEHYGRPLRQQSAAV
jgi:alpha-D-ribose 1-methylphosphonate 5-triphosphate diphosphatase PhnM